MNGMRALLLACAAVLALAACGGGNEPVMDKPGEGDGATVPPPSDDDDDVVVSPPNDGDDDPPGDYDPLEEVNVILLSDAIFDLEDRRVRLREWECREDLSFICTARVGKLEAYADPRGEFTYQVFGDWEHLHVAGVVHAEGVLFAATAGVSHPNSLPTGSATWTGKMVGVFRPPETPIGTPIGSVDHAIVGGGAEITLLDLQAPAVDVVLTPVSLPAMTWKAVPVEADGEFEQEGPVTADAPHPGPPNRASYIRGQFYGPNAEEVGGVFERAGIIGAFAAGR